MDSMLQRFEALECQTHTVARRLHLWRGLACALAVLGLLTWTLPSVTAQDAREKKDLEARVAALEDLLKHFSRADNEVFITGANLHIVNSLGRTDCTDAQGEPIPDCPNGLGNLIVGYNEPRPFLEEEENPNNRTGSHNVVVGNLHNFSSVGGLVVGQLNEISGRFPSVSAGSRNTASGFGTSVSGGHNNTASDFNTSVAGGEGNRATRFFASVSGGFQNTASEEWAAVSGGTDNVASGRWTVVSGGQSNTASSDSSTVAGGFGNTASGGFSSVSGGQDRTAEGNFDWVAGSLVEDD